MKKLLRFLSLAVLTQLTLMVNQLAILPAQLRIWGADTTAGWYSAMAVAMLASVADLGLRSARHGELLRCYQEPTDLDATRSFQRAWSWVRITVLATSLLLLAGDALIWNVSRDAAYPVWRLTLIAAMSLETILISRVMYLDTLGYYDRAELGYFLFSFCKAGISLAGLLIAGWHESALALVNLFTVIFALLMQSWLAKDVPVIALTARMRTDDSGEMYKLTLRAMSEPVSNWTRLSLPVLALAAVAPSAVVNIYVALRALFGLVRACIQQVARPASYEILQATSSENPRMGDTYLSVVLFAGSLFGAAFSFVLAADDQRLVSLWLGNQDHSAFLAVLIPFGVGTPFYVYQILNALRVRTNDLHSIAQRQYGYVVLALACSAVAVLTHNWKLYTWLMLGSEVVLSFMIMTRLNEPLIETVLPVSRRGFRTAAFCALSLAVFWQVVVANPYRAFTDHTIGAIGTTALTTVACMMASIVGVALLNRETTRAVLAFGASRWRSLRTRA